MLVTFKCEAHEDITMLGNVAVRFLKILGHSGTIPGAIMAADVPEALMRLKQVNNQVEEKPAIQPVHRSQHENEEEDRVSLAQRAFPLIELFTNAAKEKKNIMWEEG